MKSIRVSVIIPIYNGERWVEKCACSLFEQTLQEIEYIFINDCSTDKSIDLIKKLFKEYPRRQSFFKMISHCRNQGVASARNTGIEHAQGEYLFFIDQDDYLDTDALEIFYREAVKEKADIVYSDFLYQYKYYCKRCKNKEMKNKQSFVSDLLKFRIAIALWMRLYKKELFTKYALRFPENTAGADDLALVPILFYYADRVKYIPFAPYHYIQYNVQSVSKQRVNEKWAKACMNAVWFLEDFFQDKDKLYREGVAWAVFYAKMGYIEHTRGEMQAKMCSSLSERDMQRAHTIREKRICYLGQKKLFFLLNLFFDLNSYFKSFLLKFIFQYRLFFLILPKSRTNPYNRLS